MSLIAENLASVWQRIQRAETEYNRVPGSVALIAVSKTKPVELIQQAIDAGQYIFGESYAQEAIAKKQQLAAIDLEWHFIGPIQSNKSRPLAEQFDWIHSVDRQKIAQRLNDQRPTHLPPINILLQVNLSNETTKSGVGQNELKSLVESIIELPNLRLRGLMAIPLQTTVFVEQRAAFHRLAEMQSTINRDLGLGLDCLSMGMSGDMEAAIAEGATHIRIGTDIFGAREYK